MEVNNINSQLRTALNDLSAFRVGQVLKVEVLSNIKGQEAQISLGDKIVNAKLETPVRTGDKFLATVKNIEGNLIVLSKEVVSGAELNRLSPEVIALLLNRGLGFEARLVEFLQKFISEGFTPWQALLEESSKELNKIREFLSSIIPEWSSLSGKNYGPLINFFLKLGLGNEFLIYSWFKRAQVFNFEDFQSLKTELLRLLEDPDNLLSKEQKNILQKYLDSLTGQQLWYQNGAHKNAYSLLLIPLQLGEDIYYVKAAIESLRRGKKMDSKHCHISLELDSSALGKIGADILIYEKNINLCLLHDNYETLKPLIEKLKTETKESFRELGLNLQNITLKKFEENPLFFKFIAGQQLGGVDVRG
ncbi:MAG: hypothetical protein ACOX7U_06155 [Desulfitobacteriia bacterium]|jgi:hypothetical protein